MDKKKQYHKEYYIKNKEKMQQYYKEHHKKYYVDNIELIKDYYVKNKEKILKYSSDYYYELKDEIRPIQNEYSREYYIKNRSRLFQGLTVKEYNDKFKVKKESFTFILFKTFFNFNFLFV